MNSEFLLGLCILLLFHGCYAQLQSECQINRITARQPNRVVKSEAGVSEFWISEHNDELDCAGVEAVRHTINTKGLVLPFYANAPQLAYVIRGSGIQGTSFPGCPDRFESSIGSGLLDRHQKVFRFKEGDILALPAGAVHWTYNDGNTRIVLIVLRDTTNQANQLDQNFRKFFLAGNPQSHQGESNIFNGFADEILQEVFNVEPNVARQLKGQRDNRGLIVDAENFHVMTPDQSSQNNGIEETICSNRLRANIADPTHADVYNPRGGRLASLNSRKLPVLNRLQLSAEKGLLYKNAVLAPHYNLNAHSIMYVTSGSSRLQIVRNDGTSVFNGWVQEGQLIVVPQDFAVLKKAGEQGCEWVAFKTNDKAVTTQLAGRFSFLRALPEEVVSNSYEISREQAKELKYSRQEGVVLSPIPGSSRQKGMNYVLS